MAEPFLSEIRIFSFNYAPQGWAMCNGQLLPINQNQALFALLGTTYGGNGQNNFALPDLRGRAPDHFGNGHGLGEGGGEMVHTLTLNELPTHLHGFNANSCVASATANASAGAPTSNYWANSGKTCFSTADQNNPINSGAMNASTVGTVGGSQPHQNMQPYLVLNFCIALLGIFPSQN